MISIENISAGYGRKKILEGISFRIDSGKLTALLGRNGSGKSTLLNAIATHDTLISGKITVDGKEISTMDPAGLSRVVSIVGTERIRIPDLRCSDLVALGRAPYTDWIGKLDKTDKDKVEEALEAVGMEDYAGRTMDSMSDGECQKIMIARALAQDTPVLLLDEPTAFLDIPGRYRTVSLLHKLAAEKGKTILYSTHDLDSAIKEADLALLVEEGSIYLETPQALVEKGLLEKVFGIEI